MITPVQVNPKEKVTIRTIVLFLIGFSVVASGFSVLRPKIGSSLTLQPYLIPLTLGFFVLGYNRIRLIPLSIINSGILFVLIFISSIIIDELSYSLIVKAAASVFIIIAIPTLIQNKTDYKAGVYGLLFAVAVLALRGVDEAVDGEYVKILDSANKNGYSLYALGPLLLSLHLLFNKEIKSIVIKSLVVLSIVVIGVVIAISGNRSGWLGMAVILFMFNFRLGLKPLIISIVLVGLGYVFIDNYTGYGSIQNRIQKTQKERGLSNQRQVLFFTSLRLGLENPILGLGPYGIQRELAKQTGKAANKNGTSPHNLPGYLLGGTGLTGFVCFCYFGWSVVSFPKKKYKKLYHKSKISSYTLMRMLAFLFFVRSIFQEEIIFIPGFPLCFGLVMGLTLYDKERYQAAYQAMTANYTSQMIEESEFAVDSDLSESNLDSSLLSKSRLMKNE